MLIPSRWFASSSSKACALKETSASSATIWQWNKRQPRGTFTLIVETSKLRKKVRIYLFLIVKFALDTMDNWDEEKLKEVVEKKHSAANKSQTSIVVSLICILVVVCVVLWQINFFSANTSSKPLKKANMDGSGNAPMEETNVSTGTVYPRATS